MKKILCLLILLLNFNLYSQFGSPNIIPSNVDGLSSIFSADFDGDGDMDVVSTSRNDRKLAWYENADGNGTFVNEHILVTNNDNGPLINVFAADIDNDNDMDIIVAYCYLVAWYRNVDGLGTFSGEQILGFDDLILMVQAVDIDGDGFKDIIYSDSHSDSIVQWFKNIDGLGNFGQKQTIAFHGLHGPHYFSVNDIDGDGDLDVAVTDYEEVLPSNTLNNISWFENIDGNGNFGAKQIILTDAGTPSAILSTDIDNDGFIDIIVASRGSSVVYYLKNLDGLGTFGDRKNLASGLGGAISLFNYDFDYDGDQDLLVASYSDDTITLLINDGVGNFNDHVIISANAEGAISVFASDVDGDNITDIISASNLDNVIAWYGNEFNLSIESNDFLDLSIYPNPTESILNIESKTKIVKIEVYNQLGQLVLQNKNKNEISILGLSKGIYFIKIKDLNQNIGIRKIVKK